MDLPEFKERAPWWGGHLQTVRNTLWPYPKDLAPWPGERRVITFKNGDKTSVLIHGLERASTSRCVLLIHGLTGCEDSVYLRQTARCFLQAGACVIRANLRGAGPLGHTAEEHYNGGRSEDLVEIIDGLLGFMPDATLTGLWVIGYSLGGNLLLKLLGDDQHTFWPIAGAVSVSAPIDMKLSQLRMMEPRNSFYQRYLLNRMKAETPKVDEKAKALISTVWQFDQEIVAPAGGFAGAEDYYAKSSAKQFLGRITTPTLLMSADNDPWIPKEMYETGDWRDNPNLHTVITRGGGHVGFHGAGSLTPWHSRAALAFLRAKGQ